MKVLLVDVDGLLPNIALMKLSAEHKRLGDEIYLLRLTKRWFKHFGKSENMQINARVARPDKCYISCIFSKNKLRVLSMKVMLESLGARVEVGGVGVDMSKSLPDDVEHIMPDYSLYPRLDYSMGYTSRGCIRRCPWCIVWRKEGDIKEWAMLSEFVHRKHERVMLFDNNLLAAPNWERVLNELIVRRLKVCFTQGNDIRLVDDDNAKLLRLCKYYNGAWTRRRLYFSFDEIEEEEAVLKGIEVLGKHSIPPNRLLFYTLVGYGVKPEEYTWQYFMENDYHRFEVLRKIGVLPFVMVYNGRRDIPLLKKFARWVNWHWYNSFTFEQYLKHEAKSLMLKFKV